MIQTDDDKTLTTGRCSRDAVVLRYLLKSIRRRRFVSDCLFYRPVQQDDLRTSVVVCSAIDPTYENERNATVDDTVNGLDRYLRRRYMDLRTLVSRRNP